MKSMIATAATLLALTTGADRAAAQVYGSQWYNPYTGRYSSNYSVRNPWTGAVVGRNEVFNRYTGQGVSYGTGYNPWTGSFYQNRLYQNPWTGRVGVAGSGYNPWTGVYGYRYRW